MNESLADPAARLLSSALPPHMALVDCETTGGRSGRDRLTEVAVIQIDHGQVTGRWQTLLNPEVRIPPWIVSLTGISQPMVTDAPAFADIAAELWQQLEGRVLVAHNARFDYGFIREAFRRCGYDYQTRPLCSVRLCRQLFPQWRGYGLDAIIPRLNLTPGPRHRAMGDTLAILGILEHVTAEIAPDVITAACQRLQQRSSLPSQLSSEAIDQLPQRPGVYRFLGNAEQLLYVGKSVSIRSRVLSHFTPGNGSARQLEKLSQVARIDYTMTPSDFGAQLLENHQIKALSPLLNRRQKRTRRLYQFELAANANGYEQLRLVNADMQQPTASSHRYGLFRSRRQAEQALQRVAPVYGLCDRLSGVETSGQGACFGYQLGRCNGACVGAEAAAIYNLRIRSAMTGFRNQAWPWDGAIRVLERSAHDSAEYCCHIVDQWVYQGVEDCSVPGLGAEIEAVTSRSFDLDTYRILVRFLLSAEARAAAGLHIEPLTAEPS